jgi:hypothetical protein
MAKKKKHKSKYSTSLPTSFGTFNAGDQVTFTRVSDGGLSIGRIWYFYVNIDRPSVLLIDLILGNFQLGHIDELNVDIAHNEKKALRAKAKARGIRP